MSPLEVVLRAVGVVLLALLAAALLRSRRRDDSGRVTAALAASVAAFLITSAPGASRLPGVLVYPLATLCSTHPVWFWLACTALFGDRFRLTRVHFACVAAMGALGLAQWLVYPLRPWFAEPLWLAFAAASLAFIVLGPLTVLAGRRADLDERRRRIRRVFLPSVSLWLAAVVITQLTVLSLHRPTPRPLVLLNLAVIDALAGAALLWFVRLSPSEWFELAEAAPARTALTRAEARVLERLEARLRPERLYARTALSLGALAAILGTQEHVLRRVINRGLGFRNFNDFLHTHRLQEAAQRLRDPVQARLPVLTIALESGYGSIGPFNRAFRARFGVTPTQFRRGAELAPGMAPAPVAPEAAAGGAALESARVR
jgi:AraC-like DNA-binding protein